MSAYQRQKSRASKVVGAPLSLLLLCHSTDRSLLHIRESLSDLRPTPPSSFHFLDGPSEKQQLAAANRAARPAHPAVLPEAEQL